MSYSVQFGDLSTMPSCSCFDWQKHHWPCKHFLAIYKHFPEWGWEAMSPIYKDSPYFKIDSNVVPDDSMMISTLKASTDTHDTPNTVPPSGEVYRAQSDEVPLEKFIDSSSQNQPIINLKHEGRSCREILKELQNLTYLCTNGNAFQTLKDDLQTALNKFKQCLPSESGILIEAPKSKQPPKLKKGTTANENQPTKTKLKDYARLPLRLSLKRKHENGINISPPESKQKNVISFPEQDISSTLINDNGTHNTNNDLEKDDIEERNIVDHQQSSVKQPKCNFEATQIYTKCVADAPENNLPEFLKKDKIVIDENSPDPETWLTVHNTNQPDSKVTLYLVSKTNILNPNGWLSDSEIHAGQMLLKMEFPLVDGLCDPAVTGDLVTPDSSEFVQIINTGAHWVCMSTISTSPGTVKLYDTLYNTANSIAIRHACHMLMFPGDSVSFVNEKVQRQLNHDDCGLFALAIATDLCHSVDPVTQSYDQSKLRQHYVNCLESRKMAPFPKTSRRVIHHLGTEKQTIAIYCVCRLPNDKQEYVQCFHCHGWYHPSCVNVPEWALKTKRRWRCDKCMSKNIKKPYLH